MARERSGSPVERYVAAHLPADRAGTVVFLHADARVAVHDAARRGGGGSLVATHRRLPVVEALRRDAALGAPSEVQVLHAHGRIGLPELLHAEAVVIRLPTEKLAFHQLLRDATELLSDGGVCLLFGGNDEGIKSAARTMEQVFGQVRVLAHSGGHRLLAATLTASLNVEARDALAVPYHEPSRFRELSATVRGAGLTWFTRPGVFSWDHLDEATAILVDVMEISDGASLLDLGCGAGVLGAVAGRLSGGPVTLVDADSEAVRCATQTMLASGVADWRVLASDVTGAVKNDRFDVVVCNPPFHTGKQTDLALPVRFIEEAYAVLNPGGRLQLVANRTLPYENELERIFGNRRTMHDGTRFKVLEATRR